MSVRTKIETFRQQLSRVFDDNLETYQWHNILDYVIIGMIILSTTEVFISTFEVSATIQKILHIVDLTTLIFFTIEVTLRIWVADLLHPEYKGFWGRVKYCFTFYGLIDILSTYPFYIQWLIPIPYQMFKILRTVRVIRILRIARYAKSFHLLANAIRHKKQELIVSLQFLVVITFILSLLLFFVEHNAQPEAYKNGMSSFIWAFMQYIGDPGNIATNPPQTVVGGVIACIVGFLGIAIFAIPAGILGAGFTEGLADDKEQETLKCDVDLIKKAFDRRLDRVTRYMTVRQYVTLTDIQVRCGINISEAVNAVYQEPSLRLINLAATCPPSVKMPDTLAVEHFPLNRPYGYCVDRGSKITVVAPANFPEMCMSNFNYYFAKMGGFNYVAREIGTRIPFQSYYLIRDTPDGPMQEFFDDITRLTTREGASIITTLACSGADAFEYDTQIHFDAGGPRGDETLEKTTDPLIRDKDEYFHLCHTIAEMVKEKYGLLCDIQKYHESCSPQLFLRHIPNYHNINCFLWRIAWKYSLWDERRLAIAQDIAKCLHDHLAPEESWLPDDLVEELKRRGTGFEDYQH